jgi:hypothetical protein
MNTLSGKNALYVAVLYSKHSPASLQFLNAYRQNPLAIIRPVCIDNRAFREQVVNNLKISYVPCVLLVYPNNQFQKFEGVDGFNWLIGELTPTPNVAAPVQQTIAQPVSSIPTQMPIQVPAIAPIEVPIQKYPQSSDTATSITDTRQIMDASIASQRAEHPIVHASQAVVQPQNTTLTTAQRAQQMERERSMQFPEQNSKAPPHNPPPVSIKQGGVPHQSVVPTMTISPKLDGMSIRDRAMAMERERSTSLELK